MQKPLDCEKKPENLQRFQARNQPPAVRRQRKALLPVTCKRVFEKKQKTKKKTING